MSRSPHHSALVISFATLMCAVGLGCSPDERVGAASLSMVSHEPGLAPCQLKHAPYLQLGDAPLVGYSGSDTDQLELMWQFIGDPGDHHFEVSCRPTGGSWKPVADQQEIDTGVGQRVNVAATLLGLEYDSAYEYRVTHGCALGAAVSYQNNFRTRLASSARSSMRFAAYGDSATRTPTGFIMTQTGINRAGVDFSLSC